jgi:hypothetical protein
MYAAAAAPDLEMTYDHMLNDGVKEARFDYPWDDWAIHDEYASAETGWYDHIVELADAPSLALAIALAEWIWRPLQRRDPSRTVGNYIESSWAVFSDRFSPSYFETRDIDWRGPDRALLAMTLINLNDAIFCRDEDPVLASRTDWILFYAQKIFSKSPRFDAWLQMAMAELAAVDVQISPRLRGSDPAVTRVRPSFSREFFSAPGQPSFDQMEAETTAWLAQRVHNNPFLNAVTAIP